MLPEWAPYWTNVEIVGAPRHGKTTFIVCCNRIHILNDNRVMYFAGGKDDAYDGLVSFIAQENPLYAFSLLNISDGDRVTGYNPFLLPTGRNLSAHVSKLAESLLGNVSGQALSDLQNFAEVAEVFFAYLAITNVPLHTAVPLLEHSNRKAWSRMDLPEQYQYIARSISETDAKNWEFKVASLRRRLRPFVTSDAIRRTLAVPKPVVMSDLYEQGVSLFVKATPSRDLSPEAARVMLGFMLSDLFQVGVENAGKNKKYDISCDEIQQYAPPIMGDILDTALSAGLHFTLSHHYDNQIKDGRLRESLAVSCGIKVVFGGLPAEKRKVIAENAFSSELNTDWKRQPKKSYVTFYDEEYYEETTDSETFSDDDASSEGMSGENETSNQQQRHGWSTGSSTRRGSRLRPRVEEVITGWEFYSQEEKISRLAGRLVLPPFKAMVILPDKTIRIALPQLRKYLPNSKEAVRLIQAHGIPKHEADKLANFERSTRRARKRNNESPGSLFDAE